MTKRNLFAEITEGFEALAEEREGKRTLRTHEVEGLPALSAKGTDIIAVHAAHQPAHSRKLGTGESKTECPSGLIDPPG